ncbi:Gag-Pol polyprotein [Lonchura striata]|uniref:ribonuclease H n=1 Tax=Lonchura striata TaxID=40157 RepID=A0A218VDN3_9PASE|nr:Gag-Pol polyprotein [Lonchura striata domestica]
MLDEWERNELTRDLDKMKMIYFCMEVWPKLGVEWPWFGSADAWMCTRLKESLNSQPEPDRDQLVYADCWVRERSGVKSAKMCKLKEHKEEVQGKREERGKTWDPLDHLPPPLEPPLRPRNPIPLPPPPDPTPVPLSSPQIPLLAHASSSPNFSPSQSNQSIPAAPPQAIPSAPQTPLALTLVPMFSPPSQVPHLLPPPLITPITSVPLTPKDQSQVPASPLVTDSFSTPVLPPYTPSSSAHSGHLSAKSTTQISQSPSPKVVPKPPLQWEQSQLLANDETGLGESSSSQTGRRIQKGSLDEGPYCNTRSRALQNDRLFPLREVPMGGVLGGIGYVNAPLTSSEVRSFKKELSNLVEDPVGVAQQIDQFLGPNIYTWGELTSILKILFSPEEVKLVRAAAIKIWDRENQTGVTADHKLPANDPGWDPNRGQDRRNMEEYRTLMIRGIREAVPKGTNSKLAFDCCQEKDETPAAWLGRLKRSFQQYSTIDPESREGQVLLKVQFVSKAWPDIRRKLEKLEDWQEKGINELLKEALKVYLRREEEKMRNKARMMVAVARESVGIKKELAGGMGSSNPPGGHKVLVAHGHIKQRQLRDLKCYYCGESGHFRRECEKAVRDEAMIKEQEALEKAEGKYRLVQDLREINKRTITKHPTVPDPYTLLSKIPCCHAWFTVVDLKDAFWACPLAPECRDWFAFQWENTEGNRRMQLRWTRLPQGFCESPNLFGQNLEKILEVSAPEEGVQVLQYVDDLLVSGEDQEQVRRTSIKLLNYLGEIGLKVSRNKLQFMEPQVVYLGHMIGPGYKKLNPERISGIISLPAPKTKRDIRRLLGLFGYCKLWIDSYTQKVKFLYEKLVLPDPVRWTEEDDEKLEGLKQALISAPALGLPDLKKEFHLFINTEEGVAHGVLAQDWVGFKKPIAYLSKLLDPVARGWPTCLQAIAATALIVEEANKLTFQGKIRVYTPHDIKGTLSQGAHKWLSDARILKYEIMLMSSDHLELTTTKLINPAQFLSGEPALGFEHQCVEAISLQTKVRADLSDIPLEQGEIYFSDGSSRVVEGTRKSGYAIAQVSSKGDLEVLEKGKLPAHWSAQLCEIYALKRGLELLDKKCGTIFTDSRYAFGVVHTFGKIWEERGYLNSKGRDLIHREMIQSLLEALKGPEEIAVVHVRGHRKGDSLEVRGNRAADLAAKRAAQDPEESIKILKLTRATEANREENTLQEKLIFTEQEQKAMKDLKLQQGPQGEWVLPDGRKFICKALARRLLAEMHQLAHWGTQGLCDHFLRNYVCMGAYDIARAVTQGCITCQKVNQKVMRKPISGGRELAERPFQNVQIDFTEMPPARGYKHLLVIVDHLTHWPEVFPTRNETSGTVVKILLENLIPRYGLINNIDSDQGPHFTARILHDITEALGIRWRLHTPWHPQSSGRVERMNKTIKTTLTKLVLETGLDWVQCLPLALLQIRTRPRADLGVSPYEMLFGLPFLISPYSTAQYVEGEEVSRKYLETIAKTLEQLRKKGYLPQTPPLEVCTHNINPGDWVLIKSWNNAPLTPRFEGPYQVLLTTHTAVRTLEKGWTHISRVKGPVKPPSEDTDLAETIPTWTAFPAGALKPVLNPPHCPLIQSTLPEFAYEDIMSDSAENLVEVRGDNNHCYLLICLGSGFIVEGDAKHNGVPDCGDLVGYRLALL